MKTTRDENDTPAWIQSIAGPADKPAWATTVQQTTDVAASVTEKTVPSTTLDDVNVTAPAVKPAENNPTASANPTPAYQPTPAVGGDELTLTIGNNRWDGWQRVSLTRGLEAVPASFDIQVTERYPDTADLDIKPGDYCTVQIGGDLVLTGYIDRYECQLTPLEHQVRIAGRSLSQDLVDCAAFVGGQSPSAEQYKLSGTALSIITQLAQAYGIKVNTQAGDGPQVPNFAINLGETSWEIIDRMSKIGGFVVYDMPDGSLMVATAGKETMASGFLQGVNVETAQTQFSMDQRFSVYEGFQVATPIFQSDNGGSAPPEEQNIAYDPNVPRFRKRIVISNQTDANGELITRLVKWEAARRAGRAFAVHVMCDSWRDTAQTLWSPNHLAPVDIPAVKVGNQNWCIGSVTYLKDERGRHSLVTLMPPEAFLPEPVANTGTIPFAGEQGYRDQTNNPTSNNNPNTGETPPPGTPTGNLSVGGAIPNRVAEQASTSAPTTPGDIVSP